MDKEEMDGVRLGGVQIVNNGPATGLAGVHSTPVEIERKERPSVASSLDGSKGARSISGSTGTGPYTDQEHIQEQNQEQDQHKTSRSDSGSTPTPTPTTDDTITTANRPKMSRKASQKMAPLSPVLFGDLPDMTVGSCSHFQCIPDCLYGSKSLGSTEHDTLDCDCNEEWRDGENHACGEDSDCINRATKMECVNRECNCGDSCQNQRFQRKQYADVSVIKTEKKGFGLRANKDVQAHEFIFEYIGEVINEPTFRRRMMQYDKEGIKHFYFMSLTKHEFVDATKKGNLGRFCNHSCNPNCYVDKWVVGNKLRMGIFASRKVQAGEELVFNYNVDRYGADPQPCYCGEANCIGFIGGKTQTERATKLSNATIEALGLDDADGWDTTVAVVKKPRRKRAGEEDEEYVNSLEARGLDERGVQKVMAALMQCKEKWIAVKLLERLQSCQEHMLPYVVRMHGYDFLKTTLNTFKDDDTVVLQILQILYRFPRLTKNKISDSKIETTVQSLVSSDNELVATESRNLLEIWSKLETAYRIPRKSRNGQGTASAQTPNSFEDRRSARGARDTRARAEEASVKAINTNLALPENVPKGPRSSVPQRNIALIGLQRHRRPPDPATLPAGWYIATDASGSWYYYNKSGGTQWQKPTTPAPDVVAAQKGPSKMAQEQKSLQALIDSLSKPDGPGALTRSSSQTSQQVSTPAQEPKKEKWRSLPIEKQMKIYENTLFLHVKPVIDKYRHKLPKSELKTFGRDINKKLVDSDYRNNRVVDPTKISDHLVRKIKKFVSDYFERAVYKYNAYQKRCANKLPTDSPGMAASDAVPSVDTPAVAKAAAGMTLSDDEDIDATPNSSDRKRRREEDGPDSDSAPPSAPLSVKRLKDDDASMTPPPPPPPPEAVLIDTEMAEQEETEIQQLREQEAELERENELNRLDFERELQTKQSDNGTVHTEVNGTRIREAAE